MFKPDKHECNYPDCDGGYATGYCHSDCRIVLCGDCGSEGRIYRGHPNDPHPRDDGPCPQCDGEGSEIIETEPITMEDLDRADCPDCGQQLPLLFPCTQGTCPNRGHY